MESTDVIDAQQFFGILLCVAHRAPKVVHPRGGDNAVKTVLGARNDRNCVLKSLCRRSLLHNSGGPLRTIFGPFLRSLKVLIWFP